MTLRPKGTKEGGVCPREGSWGKWWGTVTPAWRAGAVEHSRADPWKHWDPWEKSWGSSAQLNPRNNFLEIAVLALEGPPEK